MRLFFTFLSWLPVLLIGAQAGVSQSTHEIWVADQALDKIIVFDGATHQILAEIAVDGDDQPATSKPHFVSFSPDFRYAYIANVGTNNVTVIDATQRKMITQVAAGKGAHAAVASPDGKRVWVANPGDGTVTEIVVNEGQFTAGRTIPAVGTRTMVLTFSPDSRYAYVTNSGDANAEDPAQTGSIAIIEVESGMIVKILEKTGKNTLVPAWSLDGSQLYVSVGDPVNQLLALSTLAGPEDVFFGPTDAGVKDAHGIAVTPDGKLILVSRQEAKVQIFDRSLAILGSVEVGEKPDMVALSSDGQTAYVTLRGQAVTGDPFALSGTTPGLAIVDLVKGERAHFIALSGDPHGVAVRSAPTSSDKKTSSSYKPFWMLLALLIAGALFVFFFRR
jgi:YVTN family beta-propeller protein